MKSFLRCLICSTCVLFLTNCSLFVGSVSLTVLSPAQGTVLKKGDTITCIVDYQFVKASTLYKIEVRAYGSPYADDRYSELYYKPVAEKVGQVKFDYVVTDSFRTSVISNSDNPKNDPPYTLEALIYHADGTGYNLGNLGYGTNLVCDTYVDKKDYFN
jgi:hypothetical protein